VTEPSRGMGPDRIRTEMERKNPLRRFRNSAASGPFTAMIAITITPAAHQAIKASLLGTAEATPRSGPDGMIRIWLDCKFVDRLAQMRGSGENYSDVILRLAESGSYQELRGRSDV
jgi:hypothetical protein